MRNGVAPIAVAFGTADRTGLNCIGDSGVRPLIAIDREFVNKPSSLPGAGCAPGADRGRPQFNRHLAWPTLLTFTRSSGGVAVVDAHNGRLRQWHLCAARAGGGETAGQQHGEIVTTVELDILCQLLQHADQRFAFVILVGRCLRPTVGLGGNSRIQLIESRLYWPSNPGMDWECFVTGHTLNDSTGSCDKLLNRVLTETY